MSAAARQRMRLALMVLGAFGCLLALLAIQQNLEYREKAPDALAYLLKDDVDMLDDPLGIASQNLELLGVSGDETIIGYATKSDVSQTMMEIDRAMRAQGWLVLEMSTQGISSYVRQDGAGAAQAAGVAGVAPSPQEPQVSQATQLPQAPYTYVLFICTAQNDGSSVVAELL